MVIEELQSGRYRYKRLLGSGGMGDVYLMQDTRVSRQVAIKVMRAESALTSRDEKAIEATRLFQREARAIAALEHPNILPLYDFGEEAGNGMTITYMVMPYCPAGSLENWLRTQSELPLSPPEIAALVEQAAEALQYAHEHEMIHLDVKPSNFLLRSNRKKPRRPTLLLADFGIARNFTTVANSSRTIRGTPTSMAPEQWSGSPVFASDQYALAVMAYELLTGRPPFVGSLEQLMYRHFTVPSPAPRTFNPRLPAELDPVLLRALAKQPEERFPSIADFATAFVEAAQQPATPVEERVEEDVAEYATVAISADAGHSGVSRLLTLADDRESLLAAPEQDEVQESSDDDDATRVQLNHVPTEVYTVVREAPVESAPVTPPIEPLALEEPVSEQGELVDVEVNGSTEKHVPGEDAVNDVSDEPAQTPVGDGLDELHQEPIADELHTPVEPASERDSSLPGVVNDEYEQPTIVAREPLVRVTEAPLPIPARRAPRRAGWLALVSALALCVLLGGGIFALLNHQGANKQNLGHQPASTSTPQTRATVALSPTPTTTPAPGLYIAGTYNGSMADLSLQHTTLISISIQQTQGQGALKGTVTFKSPAQQVYQLSGHVNSQGQFSFTVQQPTGQVPYVFYGSFNSENNLKGSYCNSSTGSCQASAGYFNVGPREQP
jgi:serine/threonine protein kinase